MDCSRATRTRWPSGSTSGGRLWLSGPNQAETTDSNATGSPNQGRARIYHGHAGLRYEDGTVYADAPAPTPTADGAGLQSGMQLDLGPNGDGIDNQTSIEAASPFGDNDTFQAAPTTTPLFHQIGGDAPDGSAIAFARGSEPSLEEERLMFHYRTISMGFGLERVNGADAQAALAAERWTGSCPSWRSRCARRSEARGAPQLQRAGRGDRRVRAHEHHPHPSQGRLRTELGLCIPKRYARRVTIEQIAVRLPAELLADLDELVARGVYPSRAAAVRAGVEAITELERRRAADRAVAEGYRRVPPTTSEAAAAVASLRDAIAEEPW